MSRKVTYSRDDLPPLTAEQAARLATQTARPDDDIDTTDIPELT